MTRTTKAKAENKTEAATETGPVAQATERLSETTRTARGFFEALTESGRKTFEGVLEFDKAVLGMVRDNLGGAVDHGKAIVQARCIKDVIDLQATYAHASIEAAATNARELIDLARSKTQEAIAPTTEAIAALKEGRKAA